MERVKERAIEIITELELEPDKAVQITIMDKDEPRTLAQNAYYFTAMVQPLADWAGYTKEEMHEVLLGECFGTKKVGGLIVPKKRTSQLKKKEMMEYLDWVPRFAAEQGVVIGV